MNIRVLPLQAKWQLFDGLHPGKVGVSPNRCSTESWLIGRSKLMLMAWLVATLVASRPGEMLTIRGGVSAHAEARGAHNARARGTPRRMPALEGSGMSALRGPAEGGYLWPFTSLR